MIEQKINIKPLSVNDAWKGKRYKTEKYKNYENVLFNYYLKKKNRNVKFINCQLKITFEFGFSSKASDYDNPIKILQDILQKKYDFNDSYIYEANIKKTIVKKGKEFVYFKIEKLC